VKKRVLIMMKRSVGKYTVVEKIASGGMGDIFKAKHPTLNREIILKRLALGSGRNITERFKREAKLMMDFHNDRIVQVYDHFKEGQFYYIAMEYVNGITLSRLIAKKRYLPGEIARLILYEICQALKYAHDNGVIHRDIKPDNVLISHEGAVKLTDFGIATSKDSTDQCLTREMTLGTPAYMSPEQITDCSSVDKRADIYSLGVVLYEMVTGKSPFPGSITPETINAIQKGKYIKARKINPRISPVLLKIIKKTMHHNIKRRYRDLDDIIKLLEKRFKMQRYGKTSREILRTYIDEDKIIDKKNKISSKTGHTKATGRIKQAAASLLFLGGIGGSLLGYLYVTGYYHEWYQSDRYGAFQVEVHFKENRPELRPRYINAQLLKKVRNKFIPAENVKLGFHCDDVQVGGPLVYKTQRAYVNTAQYRLLLDVDNVLYINDLDILSRDIQKEKRGDDGVDIVVFTHNPAGEIPVTFHYSIYDAHTGLDMTDEADIYIYFRRQWVRWKDFSDIRDSAAFLTSGKTFYIKIQKNKYYKKILSVTVEPHQSCVFINADIVPYPGTLIVKSAGESMVIKINNSTSYIQGGNRSVAKTLKPLSGKYQRIILAPGTYILSVDGDGVKETRSVDIESGKYTRVIVGRDKQEKSINFTIL